MAGMYCIRDLLELLIRERATELSIVSGRTPVFAANGEKLPIDVPELSRDEVMELLNSIATDEQKQELQRCGDVRFIHSFQNSVRFSIMASLSATGITLTIRNLGR